MRKDIIFSPRSPFFPAVVTSISITLIYLGFLSARYNSDGVLAAFFISKAVYAGELGKTFHPHHLMYNPLCYLFFQLLSGLGIHIGMITSMQILNTIFAFFILILFQVFCFRLTHDIRVSIVATVLLGFSFGFWFFSVEPEVYTVNTFFILLGFFLLWRWTGPGPQPAWPLRAIVLGLLGALAMAGHITSGLFMLPLGLGALLYMRTADGGLRDRVGKGVAPFLLLSLVAFSAIGVLYYIGYRNNPFAVDKNILAWTLDLADPDASPGHRHSYWQFSTAVFKTAFIGFYRDLLAGAEFRHLDHPRFLWLRIVTLAGAIWGLALYLAHLRRLFHKEARTHILLLLYILPLAGFSIIWEPNNFEIKVALLPPLWLAYAIGVAEYKKGLGARARASVMAAAIVVALTLFAHNFSSSIKPGSQPELNQDLQRSDFIGEHTEPGSVVYLAGCNPGYLKGKFYIIYFSNRQTRVVDWILGQGQGSLEPLVQSLDQDHGRPVYVLSELIDPGPVVDKLNEFYQIEPGELIKVFSSRKPVMTARMKDGFSLYRLAGNRSSPSQKQIDRAFTKD